MKLLMGASHEDYLRQQLHDQETPYYQICRLYLTDMWRRLEEEPRRKSDDDT